MREKTGQHDLPTAPGEWEIEQSIYISEEDTEDHVALDDAESRNYLFPD